MLQERLSRQVRRQLHQLHRTLRATLSMHGEISSCKGASYNSDGSLSYRTPSAKDLAHRIQSTHKEVEQGIFTPDRENDELTRNLRRKEHPGRTRGTRLVPWGVSSQADKDTYRSRLRKRAEQEPQWHDLLQAMRVEVIQHSDRLRAVFEEKLSRIPVAPN
jgi:hypothetical protein